MKRTKLYAFFNNIKTFFIRNACVLFKNKSVSPSATGNYQTGSVAVFANTSNYMYGYCSNEIGKFTRYPILNCTLLMSFCVKHDAVVDRRPVVNIPIKKKPPKASGRVIFYILYYLSNKGI